MDSFSSLHCILSMFASVADCAHFYDARFFYTGFLELSALPCVFHSLWDCSMVPSVGHVQFRQKGFWSVSVPLSEGLLQLLGIIHPFCLLDTRFCLPIWLAITWAGKLMCEPPILSHLTWHSGTVRLTRWLLNHFIWKHIQILNLKKGTEIVDDQ